MRVSLFYLAKPTFGGWVSFTEHMFLGLKRLGHDVELFQVGKKTEKQFRKHGDSVPYRNLDTMDACIRARRSDRAIITAVDKSQVDVGGYLIDRGATLVVHDPTEMKEALLGFARGSENVVTIREMNVDNLRKLGVKARYIPHPFVRVVVKRTPRYHATAFSRVDWDKHTGIICAANEILPKDKRIQIFGHENRLFTHNKLNKSYPRWRRDYHGAFPLMPFAGCILAARSTFAVDMSVISGDGDGTQYTFMEAWNGGAVLVVNQAWLRTGKGAIRHGETALAVSDTDELVQVIQGDGKEHARVLEGGRAELEKHSPELVIPMYLDGRCE